MNLTFTTKNVIALTKYYDRNHNTTNHYIVYLCSSFYAIFKLNTTNQKNIMKKTVFIFTVGFLVLSCSKKDTTTQTDITDSLSADTITSETAPVQPDTMIVPATHADSTITTIPADSATKTR